MSAKQDYICDIGSTWTRTLFIRDENDVDIDLTGATAVMQVRSAIGGDLLLEIDTSSGIVITPLLGRIDLTISAETTTALDISSIRQMTITESMDQEYCAYGHAARYAIEVTYPSGIVERILEGYFCLTPEIVTNA